MNWLTGNTANVGIRRKTRCAPNALRTLPSLLLAASVSLMGTFTLRAEPKTSLPVSVPVKTISNGKQVTEPPRQPNPPQPPPPQPTLPSGKLPQYRLGREIDAPEDGAVRFILALPDRPLLLQVFFKIDGQPFGAVREKRIQALLRAVEQDVAGSNAKETPRSETKQQNEQPAPDEESDASESSANDVSYRPATTDLERIRRYMAATGRKPSATEVGWLLAHRVDGPTLLLLNDGFQAFRADQRPVFAILDRDRDGSLSRSEIDGAEQAFRECDLNRDEIVDYVEIGKVAADPRRRKDVPSLRSKLLFPIPAADVEPFFRGLAAMYAAPGERSGSKRLARFDANANGEWDREDLKALGTVEPDLQLTIHFDTNDPTKSRVSLDKFGGQLAGKPPAKAAARRSTVAVTLADFDLELSAVQSGASDQISIGAVNDGYPMLPVLDTSDDGRFTIRELRRVTRGVRTFDRDGDGTIVSDEIRPTVRLCFGLGPLVHRELASLRSVHPARSTSIVQGPEWFAQMDRNKDHDLTRGEFPGTDAQFKKLDADGDGLVSAQEALDFDKQSDKNQNSTKQSP